LVYGCTFLPLHLANPLDPKKHRQRELLLAEGIEDVILGTQILHGVSMLNLRLGILSLLGFFVFSGCSLGTMVMPSKFQEQSELMPIRTKGNMFSLKDLYFGKFGVVKADRSWTKKRESVHPDFFETVEKTTVHENFTFEYGIRGQARYTAMCRNAAMKTKTEDWWLPKKLQEDPKVTARLKCAFTDPSGKLVGKLGISAVGDSDMDSSPHRGMLIDGNKRYRIRSEVRQQDKSWQTIRPLGYLIRNKAGVQVAMQLQGDMGIWYHEAMPQADRLIFVAAVGALYYYRDLRDKATEGDRKED